MDLYSPNQRKKNDKECLSIGHSLFIDSKGDVYTRLYLA